jgi:hypothetical protein
MKSVHVDTLPWIESLGKRITVYEGAFSDIGWRLLWIEQVRRADVDR